MNKILKYGLFILISIIFLKSYTYTFDSKIDLNGDNINYYIIAKSLVEGKGFSWPNTLPPKPANYPSGYVFFLSFIMLFSKNVIVLKIINGVLLLASVLLLFVVLRKYLKNTGIAIVSCIFVLLNFRMLQFASMIMSEMLYTFLSVLTFFVLFRISKAVTPLKNKYFYFLIILTAFAYHVRPQGISLVAGVLFMFLLTKNWKYLLSTALGFIVLIIPWKVRNRLVGLDTSFHFREIFLVNTWRPEEGKVDFGGLIERAFTNLESYVNSQIPSSVLYYLRPENNNYNLGNWLLGLIVITLIVYGIYKLPKLKLFVGGYLLANLGALFIIPYGVASDGRYFITIIPFLVFTFLWGLYVLIIKILEAKKINYKKIQPIIPYLFLILVIPVQTSLKPLNEGAKRPQHNPAHANYFEIAKLIGKKAPENTVICCRKPSLFYFYAERPTVNYVKSLDDKEVIKGLINKNVDFVVLEQLGYSSTSRYLLPAIQKNQSLFKVILHLKDPDTYLLSFDKKEAKKKLNLDE